jgi:hypothetical protein
MKVMNKQAFSHDLEELLKRSNKFGVFFLDVASFMVMIGGFVLSMCLFAIMWSEKSKGITVSVELLYLEILVTLSVIALVVQLVLSIIWKKTLREFLNKHSLKIGEKINRRDVVEGFFEEKNVVAKYLIGKEIPDNYFVFKSKEDVINSGIYEIIMNDIKNINQTINGYISKDIQK